MQATVLRVTANRVCEARTDNDVLFVFPVPAAVILKPDDTLDLGQPILAGDLHLRHLTRGSVFDSTIKENDVHDLRLPA